MNQEIKRRLIASFLVAVAVEVLWVLIISGIGIFILFDSVLKDRSDILLKSLPDLFPVAVLSCFAINFSGIFFIMPIVAAGSYYQFWVSGDYHIDKYWKNPKIKP